MSGADGSLAVAEDVFAVSRGLFEQVAADLAAPATASLTHSQLEDVLSARMRQVTRSLYQDHLTLRAVTEQRLPEITDARGVQRTRIERGRVRDLTTVFGKVTVTRIAYRGTGVADLHPADAVLNLPVALHSHGLGKPAAVEAARGSFAEATDRINTLTGAGIGPRQTRDLAVGAAVDRKLSTHGQGSCGFDRRYRQIQACARRSGQGSHEGTQPRGVGVRPVNPLGNQERPATH